MGAPVVGSGLYFKNYYPRSREDFLIHSGQPHSHLCDGLGANQSENGQAVILCSVDKLERFVCLHAGLI